MFSSTLSSWSIHFKVLRSKRKKCKNDILFKGSMYCCLFYTLERKKYVFIKGNNSSFKCNFNAASGAQVIRVAWWSYCHLTSMKSHVQVPVQVLCGVCGVCMVSHNCPEVWMCLSVFLGLELSGEIFWLEYVKAECCYIVTMNKSKKTREIEMDGCRPFREWPEYLHCQ